MSRSFTRSLLSIATLSLIAVSATDSQACGRGGGGGGYRSSGRLSIAYSRNVPHMRSHAPQVNYHQPNYRQPVISQPAIVQPVPTAVPGTIVQQPAIQQPIVQQPAQQQPIQQPLQQAATTSAEQSALSALAAMGAGQPTATPAAASPIPQFGPAATTPSHLGAWTATLPGENRVQLQLQANGAFRWVANSRGKVSTFDGTFTVAEGRLILVRTNDQQQLAGSWVIDTNGGYRFKLDGANDAGLLFVRG